MRFPGLRGTRVAVTVGYPTLPNDIQETSALGSPLKCTPSAVWSIPPLCVYAKLAPPGLLVGRARDRQSSSRQQGQASPGCNSPMQPPSASSIGPKRAIQVPSVYFVRRSAAGLQPSDRRTLTERTATRHATLPVALDRSSVQTFFVENRVIVP